MSEDRANLVTFASAGFLVASIMIFSLVALPELMPTTYPQLRQGTIEIWAKSTSGELVNPLISDMQVTIASMAIHRVGVGEGSWISLLDSPSRVNPVEIAETPVSLKEAKVPIGEYNLLAFTFGDATVTIAGRNAHRAFRGFAISSFL